MHVWLDRLPMYDASALFVTRYRGDRCEILRSDGEWLEFERGGNPDPTLRIDGPTWRELRPLLIEALGALPPAAPEAEVKVLREWLAVEQARVERAFDR